MKQAEALLRSALETGACILPGGKLPEAPGRYPTVFVHGLLGWGEQDELNRLVPYWGLAGGNLLRFLRECGWECRSASVGPLSSAWDRACELYAALTGTRVDYGAAHARRFSHARYGKTYENALVPDWSAARKVRLIGHSFGGATCRLLASLLETGCAEEVQAAETLGEPVSPLFTGGKGGWVHSVTALAAPHNGSTFFEAQPDAAGALAGLLAAAAKALGVSAFKGVYDFKLDQFGIVRDPDETMLEAALRMLMTRALPDGDNIFDELTVDGAHALNDQITTVPGVYYLSVPTCRTAQRMLSYAHTPALGMVPLLRPFSAAMGEYYDRTTAGGVRIDRAWLPNDGLVNTVSARVPVGSVCAPHRALTEGAPLVPGMWNVAPAREADHLAIVGGVFNTGVLQTRRFYRALLEQLDGAAPEV